MATYLTEAVTALPGAAASAVAWRVRRQLHITVIVKATFAFAADADMPRVEPQPILRAEVHHGKNPARSICLTTDLAPYLARADVVFTGHAHAPPGGPVRELPVRLAVFDGERARLDKTLTARDSKGFQRMAVVYEQAYGGFGVADNPFGTGAGAGSTEPGLVDPAQPTRPVGLAPFGKAWPTRKRLLGATPRAAIEGDIAEIPDDFDWSYYQAAPPDQRTEHLGGGEWLVLEGLHPTLPRLRTRLPSARGLARVHGLGAFGVVEGQLLELVADTLRVDGDEQRCTLVWRRSFPVYSEDALAVLRIVAGVEVAGTALCWTDAPAAESPIARAPQSAGIKAPPPPLPKSRPVPRAAPPAPRAAPPADATVVVMNEPDVAPRAALPFAKGRAAPILPAVTPPSPSPDAGETIALSFEDDAVFEALPFSSKEQTLALDSFADQEPSQPRPAPMQAPISAPLSVQAPISAPLPPSEPIAPPGDGGRTVRVVHQTPFAVEAAPSRLAPGDHAITMIVAASCDLAAGGPAQLRPKAEPPGDLAGLALLKPRADVTLVGNAYAPTPGARRGDVTFRFGHEGNAFERRVAVFGDRRWRKGKGLPTLTEPEPFDLIPLDHERAYGGPGHRANPVGVGHDLPTRACDQAPLPNLEDPEHPIRSLAHQPDPACLAPVPLAWREAIDSAQSAPASQQLAFLAGDEPFAIEGARPRGATLTGTLPGIRARCFARKTAAAGGAFDEVPLQLDTAAFDADALTLRLVFHGTLPVEDEAAPGKTVASIFVMIEPMAGERATLEQARARLEGR